MVDYVLMTVERSDIFRKLLFLCIKMNNTLIDVSQLGGMSDKQNSDLHLIKHTPSSKKNGFGHTENF